MLSRDTPPRPVKDQNAQPVIVDLKVICKGKAPAFSRRLDGQKDLASNGISPLLQSRGLEGGNALSVQTGGLNYGSVQCDSNMSPQPLPTYDSVVMEPTPVRIMSPRVLNPDGWSLAASYHEPQYSSDDASASGSSSDGRVSEPTSRDSDMGLGMESMFNLYQQHEYELDSSHWLEGGAKGIDEDLTPRRCSNPLHQALDSIQTD